jgi:uncharacterized membrane protein YagU involved in acid resistance
MASSKQQSNVFLYTSFIGAIAGLIWGSVRILFHYLHFTKLDSTFVAEPFFNHSFLTKKWGVYIGLFAFVLFSMVCANLYALFFRKIKGPWPGIGFGIFIWATLFMFIGPAFDMIRAIWKWDLNTMIAECCIFLMWGLFIGYSISYEFTNEMKRQP